MEKTRAVVQAHYTFQQEPAENSKYVQLLLDQYRFLCPDIEAVRVRTRPDSTTTNLNSPTFQNGS